MRSLLLLPLLLCPLLAKAQIGRKELRTDTGTVVLHFFRSGGVSTKEWTDKDERWGRSWAYKLDGTVLEEHQTRRFAGHASVQYRYHANGAVSRVEYSDAPDGGIQWYQSTTTYDEAGTCTGFAEQGQDDHGPIPGVVVPGRPYVQEVVVEQRLFVNEVFVVNPTKRACRVVAKAKHPSPGLPGGTWTMAPGDTVRLGTYSMGEVFTPWNEQLTLAIHQVRLKGGRNAMARIRTDEVQASPEHRRHYVVIAGWTRATAKADKTRKK
jgi:hypothetical protein